MRLCRFERADRSAALGLLTNNGVQDLSEADPTLPLNMCQLISNWPQYHSRIEYLSKRLGAMSKAVKFLPPLDCPGKVLCIGLNYRDHAAETKASIPEEPIVFNKPTTTLIGDGDPIILPAVSQSVDFEAELVVVMGAKVKNCDRQTAAASIFGYTVGHDVSARDWQKDKPGRQWFLGKSFDTFAPLGPAVVTADSLPDPNNLAITCHINGELMQSGNTSDMIFDPVTVISYLSQVMTLLPGDLIFTGTPAGVGMARTPPRFLRDGDVVTIEIEHIGRLTNPVKA